MKKLVAVYGPSNVAENEPLYTQAYELGSLLAKAGFSLVTGSYEGVMEASSKGASESGGSVVGIVAEVYSARGREPNRFITKQVRVKSAVDQMMELLDLPDASIAIGNNPGTLIEVMMLWDYIKKGFLPKKPIIVVGKEWKELIALLDRDEHFASHRELISLAADPKEAIQRLIGFFGEQRQLPELTVLSQ